MLCAGNYHENNILEANTYQSMVPLASPSNNNGSLVPAAPHGRILPLSLQRANPPPPLCTLNMALSHAPPVDSVEISSSSNNVGMHSLTNNNNICFPNSAKPTIPNHLQLAHMSNNPEANSLYPSPSHHLTNSSVFNDVNDAHNARLDMNNSFHSMNDHIVRPVPRRMPVPADFLPPPSDPNQTLEASSPKPDSKDIIALERALKRPLCEAEGIDITDSEYNRPMVFIPTPSFGGRKKPLKELNLFKDQRKKPCPTSIVKIEPQDEDDLDLSLHL